jgi:hypothetical protein
MKIKAAAEVLDGPFEVDERDPHFGHAVVFNELHSSSEM